MQSGDDVGQAAIGVGYQENASDVEKELVHAAQKGHREAFASLYEANVERVYRYLRGRLWDPADAEDVTAEVFIKAMKGLSSYKITGPPFVVWLLRIAHNEAINYMKKQARHRERQVPLLDTTPSDDDSQEEALRKVSIGEVSQAMRELTDLQRQVLSLRFGSELSISETARAMGRTEEATKFLQFSALRALRRVLERSEAGSHAE